MHEEGVEGEDGDDEETLHERRLRWLLVEGGGVHHVHVGEYVTVRVCLCLSALSHAESEMSLFSHHGTTLSDTEPA